MSDVTAGGGDDSSSTLTLGQRKEQFMPAFHRQYVVSATQALNISRYAVSSMQLGDSVLCSAMCYWHEFAVQHGPRAFNEVVLASACLFLAGKVEHYPLRVANILKTVFELDVRRMTEAEVAPWRDMVQDMELVLSDALGFDFQRVHPVQPVVHALGMPYQKASDQLPPEELARAKKMQATLNRCYVLSLVTPLYTKVTCGDVLATLVQQMVSSEGCEAAYEWIWQEADGRRPVLTLPDAETQANILSVFVDAFAYMRKVSDITSIDALIQRRRKRPRHGAS